MKSACDGAYVPFSGKQHDNKENSITRRESRDEAEGADTNFAQPNIQDLTCKCPLALTF